MEMLYVKIKTRIRMFRVVSLIFFHFKSSEIFRI